MKFLISCAAALPLLAGCGTAGPASNEPVPPPVVTSTPAGPASLRTGTLIGTLNPAVTQATIGTTVCRKGWTATIRPPVVWTNALKRQQLPAGAPLSAYEEDHQMPLELGGSPKDPKNLKPVLWARARSDDAWETRLHQELCAGEVSLAQAQQKISAIKRQP